MRSEGDTPTCWNCGYELSGLQVDDVCPECATPVWSRRAFDPFDQRKRAGQALAWSIAALVLLFVCLGPLAGILAVPAIMISTNIKRECGGDWPHDLNNARAAWWIGWVAAVLSILFVIVYAALAVSGVL